MGVGKSTQGHRLGFSMNQCGICSGQLQGATMRAGEELQVTFGDGVRGQGAGVTGEGAGEGRRSWHRRRSGCRKAYVIR